MTCEDASTGASNGKEGDASLEEEAPQTQGKRIKVEPGPRETKGSEDSGDEDPSSHPAPPRPEFTSVIRAGALKQDRCSRGAWRLPGTPSPPPALLHAGFLPPMTGLVYPHLQRLGPGPVLLEAFYPPLGLPYPGSAGTGLRRKGD
ncbi:Neuronal PAS domain-containing protein 1 [Saguinus oedipus]|uniref:Neuronal PAS domain-containing protein 1 n=1 Tax=Saguinus oedipus TaxID=9490 RepID=A0ABQ9U920_SAGOE|nr:Neuronal PAS domain-containing protein 1 [Saguinus oedipus]